MKELLGIYTLLPTVYFMYRSGELARSKHRNPVMWRILALLISLTTGFLFGFAGLVLAVLSAGTSNKTGIIILFFILFLIGNITGGSLFLSRLNKKPPDRGSAKKRIYRKYSMIDAVLFPRIIPRGGFLWRSVAFWIFGAVLQWFIIFIIYFIKDFFHHLSFYQAIFSAVLLLYGAVAATCFSLWYYVTYICIPRICDAGLSRDTLVLLFIPGLHFVALFMLFMKPSCMAGKSSIQPPLSNLRPLGLANGRPTG